MRMNQLVKISRDCSTSHHTVKKKHLMTKPKCVTQDKRKALHLATSYALESFVHLKEVGAALDDVLARQADFHKKNPRHIVVLTYGVVRFRKRRSRSVDACQGV